MVDKRRVRRSIKRLQRVKTWQLVILLILAIVITATFLRLNNIGMVQRRSAVIAADETGDTRNTISRLYDLQRYVTAHMNTDMGKGVYLAAGYKHAVQVAYDNASSDTNPNGNIYEKAQQVCAPKFTRWSEAYVQCTTSELAKYPAASNLEAAVNLPLASSYLHVYLSPLWSPDFAGWSVLICIALIIIILARLIGLIILRIILRRRYKSI